MSIAPRRRPPDLRDGCFGPSSYRNPFVVHGEWYKERDLLFSKVRDFLLNKAINVAGTDISTVYATRPTVMCGCGAFPMELNFIYMGPRRILDGKVIRSGADVAKVRFCFLCPKVLYLDVEAAMFDVRGVDLAEILQ